MCAGGTACLWQGMTERRGPGGVPLASCDQHWRHGQALASAAPSLLHQILYKMCVRTGIKHMHWEVQGAGQVQFVSDSPRGLALASWPSANWDKECVSEWRLNTYIRSGIKHVHWNWDKICVPKLELNMCTGGSML
ncbi:uncharacterized protein LACBIDRAFT_332208 [Laccaria bicolor S238N-H82]|uniref:Predicted protein n=1 Tax=Laccaria bicolor (strain S238N-H82 / ATCC MYA-4686) TaxID=486041 RepID=B0DRY5_LACBS|nr:uncharacterized protein LACBIDRAFT_332208 [Laccaria bicolor S238N-H82]EDR02695.1 predicted protein [Laccaria bicolor S238N-H82]|eukprot:XP_001886739.1 predicted protein [Laccaria bicolor S238N-H82]